MANLIDGKLISTQIKDELKEEVAELKKKGIEGCLAVIRSEMTLHHQCMFATRKRRVSMSESNRFRMNLQRRLRRMRY